MNRAHESYLKEFFTQMSLNFPNKWCVLHSYENLPYFSSSDVDMAFSSNDIKSLEKLLLDVAKKTSWNFYQRLWYDSQRCLYYVLKKDNDETLLALDFMIDNEAIGRYQFKTSLLTSECEYYNDIVAIPNHNIAFSYKVVKRLNKKISLQEDATYLREHYKFIDQGKVSSILEEQFGKEGFKLIKTHLDSDDYNLSEDEINFLLKEKEMIFKKSNRIYLKRFWETKRTLNRVFYPCGMVLNIPEISLIEQEKLRELLEKKVNILFRYVKINKNLSFSKNFKALSGSTLILNSSAKYNNDVHILSHWFGDKKRELKNDFSDLDKLVDSFYKDILIVLKLRDRVGK